VLQDEVVRQPRPAVVDAVNEHRLAARDMSAPQLFGRELLQVHLRDLV
jgi:hypothetical protein